MFSWLIRGWVDRSARYGSLTRCLCPRGLRLNCRLSVTAIVSARLDMLVLLQRPFGPVSKDADIMSGAGQGCLDACTDCHSGVPVLCQELCPASPPTKTRVRCNLLSSVVSESLEPERGTIPAQVYDMFAQICIEVKEAASDMWTVPCIINHTSGMSAHPFRSAAVVVTWVLIEQLTLSYNYEMCAAYL